MKENTDLVIPGMSYRRSLILALNGHIRDRAHNYVNNFHEKVQRIDERIQAIHDEIVANNIGIEINPETALYVLTDEENAKKGSFELQNTRIKDLRSMIETFFEVKLERMCSENQILEDDLNSIKMQVMKYAEDTGEFNPELGKKVSQLNIKFQTGKSNIQMLEDVSKEIERIFSSI